MIGKKSILHSPPYVQQEREGKYLLIDPLSPNWISTNKIGVEIVQMSDGRHTLNDVVERISSKHSLPLEETQRSCEEFVRELCCTEFLSEAPVLKPSYPGRFQTIAPEKLEELWIYTNNDCNLSCVHCLVGASVGKSSAMSAAQIKDLVDRAKGLGARRIYFTGGEPFLREDILELIEHVTRRLQLVILSNGTLLDSKLVTKLLSIANDNLVMQISIEGHNEKINDLIRGRGSFVKAVAGIKQLVQGGLIPIVTTTVTRLNALHVEKTTEFLASLGIQDHHILWLHPRGRGQKNLENLFVSPGQLTEIMRSVFVRSKQLGILVDNRESLRVRVQARRGRKIDLCNSCFEMLCVDSDMQVYPCPSLNGDTRFACGSLAAQTLEDIWLNSSTAQWIRENSVQKKVGCNNCYLKFLCGGGCFCQGYFNYEVEKGFGCIMAPDPYCETYKSLFEDLLWELGQSPYLVGENDDAGRPRLYASMDAELPSCAASRVKVINGAFEVAGFHCACVLGAE